MEMFTAEEFQRLAQITDSWCLSLLMPTHRTGRETKQDPIRLKNLLKEAETQFIAQGKRAADARQQLALLWRLVDDVSFWTHQDEGLAAYCMSQETYLYGTPFSLPECVVGGRRCYLAPLLPIISEDRKFYVLALSPKQVRLLEGTRHTATELELPGWPESFKELARYIDEESQLQFHTGAPPVGGGRDRAAMFHGHPAGDESSERKQRLLEYCRLVDGRLQKAVSSDTTPLVLACDQRLASIYREASSYTRVMEQPVAGNPDSHTPAYLCRKAWELVRPELDEAREAALSRCRQAVATGAAAKGPSAVVPVAHAGRVDTLLVAGDVKCWGHYDFDGRRVDLHDQPMTDDEELVNLAMVLAYVQGAEVYTLPLEQLPERESVVAALRY